MLCSCKISLVSVDTGLKSRIPTKPKLLLRQRKTKNLSLMAAKKNTFPSSNWCNMSFLNLQRKSSSACVAPPPQHCQPAPVDGDYQDLNLFSSDGPCCAGKPNNSPDFMLKLAKARSGGRNGHRNDSRELKILKEGGWRNGWVTEIACAFFLFQRSKGEGERCWNDNMLFFPPPHGYQGVDRKRQTCPVSTPGNGSFTLNKHLVTIKWTRNYTSRQAPAVTSL